MQDCPGNAQQVALNARVKQVHCLFGCERHDKSCAFALTGRSANSVELAGDGSPDLVRKTSAGRCRAMGLFASQEFRQLILELFEEHLAGTQFLQAAFER